MRIGAISGIQIRIHPTWFLIFFLISTSLVSEFARDFPMHSYLVHWVAGLGATFLFFGSVLFHEMSHSLLAKRMGYPVRSITLFVFGGVSEIEQEARTPSAEFWVAIIGPFSSFFLALFFFGVSRFVSDISAQAHAVFYRLSGINLALGIFNLLPAFPLDGGRVLRSVLWKLSGDMRRATRISGKVGQFFGYFLIVSGIWIAFGTGNLINGLWIAFIGWFLTNAAESSVQQGEVQKVLEGLVAKDIMSTDCPVVPGAVSVQDLVEHHILPTGSRCFLVQENSHLAGMISIHEIKQVPREAWSTTSVDQAMKKIELLKVASPDWKIEKVLRVMDDEKVNQLPVVQEQKLVGIITREKLLNSIRTRIALEDELRG